MKLKLGNKKEQLAVLIGVLVIVLIAALAVGLNVFKDKDTDEGTKPQKVENPPVIEEGEKKVSIVDVNSTSRPYAVMINNASDARKVQSGLQDAYIVYEMIVEGGITRYLALFMDTDTARIGSIRSARHYYLDYALENDAIYVHHGKSPQANSDFSKLKIDRIEVNESTTGWRDKDLRKAGFAREHTLFTSIEKLNKGLKNKRTVRNGDLLLKYSADSLDLKSYDGAKEANNVSIKYSRGTTSRYEYDSKNKVYKRFVNKKEHKDYVTNEQYTFKNIITYQVKNYTLDDPEKKGRQGLENLGSGTGYYISEGYAVPITWQKDDRDKKTIYRFKNGEELIVNDGNTFIQIQPVNMDLTIN